MSGWKLAGYVVEDLLGFGGSGDVWRARVASTGEPVALKRIAVRDGAQARSVRAEAALLATLDHPHLVRLHALIPNGEVIVLVLDLAGGGTLAELVQARGRITPGEAITALAPIAAALAYAHNSGVVHGDVTPSNVLFTDAGMPMLSDLGVARLFGDDAPAYSTPAYIDPAVAAGCVPGPQSDVFMLGAATLHALTGRLVWPGDSPAHVLAAAAAGQIGDVDALLSGVDVPPAMRAVLCRALSIEPSRRGTAAEFALDLRHAGTPVGVELAAGRQRVPPAPRATHRADDEFAPATSPAEDTAPLPQDSARPPFDRPRAAGPRPDLPVLTHAVRSRPRPVRARHGHRARGGLVGALSARWVGAAAGAVLIAAAAGVAWSTLGDEGSRGPEPTLTAPPSRSDRAPAPTPTRSHASAPATSVHGATALDARQATAVLAGLDDLRRRAFAERDPRLLGQVYVPGPLLGQDTALLNRLVPVGCRLLGVHTGYDQVRASAGPGGRVALVVRATLAGSLLVCNGSATGRAPGSAPSTLRIVLIPSDSGYLIAGIER